MSSVAAGRESSRSATNVLGIAGVGALVYVLADLLHELGHLAATLLPLGVEPISISTIGVSSYGSSAIVALTGPVVNLVLALALFFANARSLPPAWRYFAWLFGSVNLFNAIAYLPFSALLGSGDWAVVFNAIADPSLWRPLVGLVGLVLYVASVRVSVRSLRELCSSGVVASANIESYCMLTYWTGGLVLTAGAVFNPISPWYILTSGAAAGFGAMLGLVFVPKFVQRAAAPESSSVEFLQLAWPWMAAGAAAIVVFIGIFGPGIRIGA